MGFNLNRVEIGGTMTRDAEVTFTPKGTPVAKLSLAVNRQWKDDQGVKHEDVEFVDCEAWGRTAEVIGEHTGKGHGIFIEGRLKTDKWEDKKTGEKRSKVKIVIEKFHFVSKPKDKGDGEDSQPSKKEQYERSQRVAARSAPKPKDPDLDPAADDDIPF